LPDCARTRALSRPGPPALLASTPLALVRSDSLPHSQGALRHRPLLPVKALFSPRGSACTTLLPWMVCRCFRGWSASSAAQRLRKPRASLPSFSFTGGKIVDGTFMCLSLFNDANRNAFTEYHHGGAYQSSKSPAEEARCAAARALAPGGGCERDGQSSRGEAELKLSSPLLRACSSSAASRAAGLHTNVRIFNAHAAPRQP